MTLGAPGDGTGLDQTGPVVVKLGGEVVRPSGDSPAALGVVARDIADVVTAGVGVVVVHGGGPQASQLQKRLGIEPVIVGGRRVTDAETLVVVKMAVAGQVNVDLCAALFAAGANPVGLHGASAGTVRAHKRPPRVVTGAGPDPVDLGHVGDVDGINQALLSLLVEHRYTPVVACLGADLEGHVYNINADIVASRVALALDARALVLVTDVPAVLRDVNDPSSRIATMTAAEGRRAIADGVVTNGMIPKLEESFAALAQGVRGVLIVGRLKAGELTNALRQPGSVGTLLVA